jgi:tetratricopeptide (TPR) repeat protein
MSNFRALTFSLVFLSVSFISTSGQALAAGSATSSAASADVKPTALLKKSYDQMVDGEFRDAVDTQVLAVKADKNSVDARRYLSYSLLKIGASEEAIEQLNNLLSMTKPTTIDMLMCGEACLQSGRLKQAERWFKQALSNDPQLACAKTGLANVAAAKLKAVSATKGAPQSEELVAEAPKTTFELGQVRSEDGVIAYTVKTAGDQDTQSYASETARQLRNSTANQRVASVQPSGNGAAGNNQVVNAWANYKGIQRH